MSKTILISIIATTLILIIFFKQDLFTSKSESPLEPEHRTSNANLNAKELGEMKRQLKSIDKEYKWLSKYTYSEFQAGMNLLVYGHPEMADARKMFKHLHSLGVNSVAIAFPFYQADRQANEVREDSVITPTLNELEALIDEAQSIGLSVMLRPILDEESLMKSGYWRGEIEPTDPKAWFDSYGSLLLIYAELAQLKNVEVFNIGTELNSLQNRYSKEWLRLIEKLRSVYDGEFIYSFNWDTIQEIPQIEFVKELDHVGIDAYYPLAAPNGASVAVLEEEWRKWTQELKKTVKHKSIIITEAGMIPIAGAHRQPYTWSIPGGTVDWQGQANYYEATYNVWKPMIEGIYWWSVTLEQDLEEVDYSPIGSQTESIIKQHFKK